MSPGSSVAQQPGASQGAQPLTELTFNGLLARNASWGYLGYLARTRGLAFSPSSDLLQQIDAVGGSTLVSTLKAARRFRDKNENQFDRDLTKSLGRCAMFLEKDDYVAASSECSAAAKIEPKNPWPPMGLAEIAIAEQKYPDAVSLGHRAVDLAPMMAEAHFSLGEAFALNQESDSAVDELKETLQLDPNHVDALVFLGDLYRNSPGSNNENAENALSYYQRAVALAPDDSEVHERLASIYSDKGESVALVGECRVLEKFEPQNAEWPRKEGKALLDSENYAAAISAYGRVLALSPTDADARYRRGYAMNELKNYSGAVEELREAQRLDPKNDRVFLSLGFALENEGHYPEAIGYLNQALQLNPKECSAILDIAWVLDHEKQDSQALEKYSRAAYCAGDNPLEVLNLGTELTDVGQLEKAVEVLQHLIKIAPNNLPGHIELGVALLRLKEFGAAEGEFRKAASLDPESVLAHDNLCQILDNKGEYLDAVEECEKMVQLDPHNFRGWDLLASELENVKSYDALIESARAVTSRNPQSAAAWEEFAILLRSSGQPTQALDAARRAVALDPLSSVFHFGLGQTYASLHDTTHESTEYRSAVSLDSTDSSDIHALAVALFWKTADREDAKKLFQEIVNDGEYRVESLIDLGVIAGGEGDFKSAVAYDQKALAVDADSPNAASNLAIDLIGEGNIKDGVAQADHAVKLHPNFPAAHKALGYAMEVQHNWPAAIEQYAEAVKLDPNNPQRQIELAIVFREAGDLSNAKKTYLSVLQKEPKNVDRWIDFGNMLMSLRDDAGARDAYEKAVTLDPKNALALNNLAWFYATCFHQQFRNSRTAVRLSKRANDLTAWKNPSYIDTYAAALDSSGDPRNAVIVESEALYLAPQAAGLQAALKKYEAEAAKSRPAPKRASLEPKSP